RFAAALDFHLARLERPDAAAISGIGRLVWFGSENHAESRLADTGIAEQHDFGIAVMDLFFYRFQAEEAVDVETPDANVAVGLSERGKNGLAGMERNFVGPKHGNRLVEFSDLFPSVRTPDTHRPIIRTRSEQPVVEGETGTEDGGRVALKRY